MFKKLALLFAFLGAMPAAAQVVNGHNPVQKYPSTTVTNPEVSPTSHPYNAYCDVQNVYSSGVSITSGANALTVTGGSFSARDVGKYIIVPGAGSSGRNLETTITGYTSPTQVTLGANAVSTLSSSARRISWGHDDTAAFQLMLNNEKSIVLPAKTCFVGSVTQSSFGTMIRGAGNASVIQKLSTYNVWSISGGYNTFRDFNYDGSWTSALNINGYPAANFSVSGGYNKFTNMQSYFGGRCWELGNATQGVAINNEISYSICHDVSDVGISQYQHTQGNINHNLIYMTGLEAVTVDVYSHRTVVDENAAYNVGLYGGVAAFGWDGGNDVRVTNNYVSGSPLPCLAIASNSGNSLNGILSGNRCTGTAGGIHLIYFNGPDVGWGVGPYSPKNTYIAGNVFDSTVTGNALLIDNGVQGTKLVANQWSGGPVTNYGNDTAFIADEVQCSHDSSDDMLKIANAINSAGPNSSVKIAAGTTCNLKTNYYIGWNNFTLDCQGATLNVVSGFPNNVITLGVLGNDNTIKNCKLNGNNIGTGISGFWNQGQRNKFLDNEVYQMTGHGSGADGSVGGTTCSDALYDNLYTHNNGVSGFSNWICSNNKYTNVRSYNNAVEGGNLDRCNGCSLEDSYIIGNAGGSGGLGMDGSSWQKVTGTLFQNNAAGGIAFNNNAGSADHTVIANNRFISNGGPDLWLHTCTGLHTPLAACAGGTYGQFITLITGNVMQGLNGSIKIDAGSNNNTILGNIINGVAIVNNGTGNNLVNNY